MIDMPLMPFSIPEQIPLLLDGRKQQTTRQPRKKPLKVGDVLYCYYKPRQKKSCINCITYYTNCPHSMHGKETCCNHHNNYFGVAEVVHVRPLSLYENIFDKWAIADGFGSLTDAVNWFAKTYNKSLKELAPNMEVITFKPRWL